MYINRGVSSGVEGSSLWFICLHSHSEVDVLCSDRLHGNYLTNSGGDVESWFSSTAVDVVRHSGDLRIALPSPTERVASGVLEWGTGVYGV